MYFFYRIICSVVKLKEDHNIPFCINDLMTIYTVSRSRDYGRYYFTIHLEYPYLINNLSDSKRHTSEFVIVKRNFMWTPEEVGIWPVPWPRGDPCKSEYPYFIFVIFVTHTLVTFC